MSSSVPPNIPAAFIPSFQRHSSLMTLPFYMPNRACLAANFWGDWKKAMRTIRVKPPPNQSAQEVEAPFTHFTLIAVVSDNHPALGPLGNYNPAGKWAKPLTNAKYMFQVQRPPRDPVYAAAYDVGVENMDTWQHQVCAAPEHLLVKEDNLTKVRFCKHMWEKKGPNSAASDIDPREWPVPTDHRQAFNEALRTHNLRSLSVFDTNGMRLQPSAIPEVLPGCVVQLSYHIVYYRFGMEGSITHAVNAEVDEIAILRHALPEPGPTPFTSAASFPAAGSFQQSAHVHNGPQATAFFSVTTSTDRDATPYGVRQMASNNPGARGQEHLPRPSSTTNSWQHPQTPHRLHGNAAMGGGRPEYDLSHDATRFLTGRVNANDAQTGPHMSGNQSQDGCALVPGSAAPIVPAPYFRGATPAPQAWWPPFQGAAQSSPWDHSSRSDLSHPDMHGFSRGSGGPRTPAANAAFAHQTPTTPLSNPYITPPASAPRLTGHLWNASSTSPSPAGFQLPSSRAATGTPVVGSQVPRQFIGGLPGPVFPLHTQQQGHIQGAQNTTVGPPKTPQTALMSPISTVPRDLGSNTRVQAHPVFEPSPFTEQRGMTPQPGRMPAVQSELTSRGPSRFDALFAGAGVETAGQYERRMMYEHGTVANPHWPQEHRARLMTGDHTYSPLTEPLYRPTTPAHAKGPHAPIVPQTPGRESVPKATPLFLPATPPAMANLNDTRTDTPQPATAHEGEMPELEDQGPPVWQSVTPIWVGLLGDSAQIEATVPHSEGGTSSGHTSSPESLFSEGNGGINPALTCGTSSTSEEEAPALVKYKQRREAKGKKRAAVQDHVQPRRKAPRLHYEQNDTTPDIVAEDNNERHATGGKA
ncbi:hypothetical protein B0H15DRAFT_944441 [Mycena belliarum]|uniref:Uncharacterized protein n=1 Tax=Mycena belliarum TaxID=1033014 RepID=A0AAD6UKP7_9AGAR|nr:hypothetical protein B0H15DRAFT_944441 [Mycena belliae]